MSPAPVAGKSIIVKDLWIFPIKSCRGTQLRESSYTETGLDYDRQWMIVEESTHRFLTARNVSRMVLIHPVIDHATSSLKVHVPAWGDSPASTHSIPLDLSPSVLNDDDKFLTDCQIWDVSATGYSVGTPELNAALSGFMGKPVLLVRKGDDPRETAAPGFVDSLEAVKPEYEGGSTIKWNDMFPILLVSLQSLQDVEQHVRDADCGQENERWTEQGLEDKGLEIIRWRGNIIVDGIEPWEEDGWSEIRFEGPAEEDRETMFVAARCARCMLPNVDPETGVRDKTVPDKILRPYREGKWQFFEQKTFFGVNLVPRSSRGTLRVGDRIVVVQSFPKKGDSEYTRPEDDM